MLLKVFLILFLIINGNFLYAYGLNEKLIEKVVQGELEILDSKNFSEERKLFDTLILFFSEKKNNVNENFVIENLKKKLTLTIRKHLIWLGCIYFLVRQVLMQDLILSNI